MTLHSLFSKLGGFVRRREGQAGKLNSKKGLKRKILQGWRPENEIFLFQGWFWGRVFGPGALLVWPDTPCTRWDTPKPQLLIPDIISSFRAKLGFSHSRKGRFPWEDLFSVQRMEICHSLTPKAQEKPGWDSKIPHFEVIFFFSLKTQPQPSGLTLSVLPAPKIKKNQN